MAKFKLTALEAPELDIHEVCAQALDRLLAPPAQWACYPAGHVKLTKAQAARLYRVGLKRDWPDLLIVYQRLYGIELKRIGGQLSTTRMARTRRGSPRILLGQKDMFQLLVAAGFAEIAVAHSVEEVFQHIDRWGIPTRGRIAA